MKTIRFILMISVLMGLSFAHHNSQKSNEQNVKNKFQGEEAVLEIVKSNLREK